MISEKNEAPSFDEQRLHDYSGLSEPCYIVAFEGEEAFHSLKDQWEKLWWLSEDATDSQTWHWQYLYWKHLAPKTHPVVITARDCHGTCVALGAFFICRDELSLVSKAAFLGDKKPDYHLILARPNLAETVGLKILEHFALRFEKRVPYLELTNVPQNSYTGKVVRRFLDDQRTRRSMTLSWERETYAIPLPNTIEEYLKQLGPRSRRDFRYDRRKLCNKFSVDFRVYNTIENLDEALDAIEMVDRARWGSNSHYCITSQRSFEWSLARALCEMGIYRAFLLYLDRKPCAFVTGAIVRNLFKVASIGFDRTMSGQFSIGKVTNCYAIEHCIEHGYKEYDLTRGGEEYKKWLGAIPSTNLHVRQFRSSLDALADSTGRQIVSWLRNQNWLRKVYQRLLRR